MRDDDDSLRSSSQDYLRQSNASSEGFQKSAKERFSGASGLLFEQAMAQTRMAVCLSDPRQKDEPIVFCNQAFERLTGYDAADVVGRNCRFLQGPRTDPQQVQRIRKAIAAEQVVVVEMLNYRKDGSTFWNALHLGPIYDGDGNLRYFFGSQWDVTDIHLARSEERHAKAMAREVSHRLKNVFAVIGGIVNITGRSLNVREAAQSINSRIQALGRAYEPTLDEAFMGTIEVGQAIRSVLNPYDPAGDRIAMKGSEVRSEPNAVSTIGLTLHELATNALKYGALSVPEGEVAIAWRQEQGTDGGRQLVIDWKETGGPKPPAAPAGSGTGLSIADTLLSYSRGRLDREWEPDGLRAKMILPLSPLDPALKGRTPQGRASS